VRLCRIVLTCPLPNKKHVLVPTPYYRWQSTGRQRPSDYQATAASVSEPPAGTLAYGATQPTPTYRPPEVLALPPPPARPSTPVTQTPTHTRRPPSRAISSSSLLSRRSGPGGRTGGADGIGAGITITGEPRHWDTATGGAVGVGTSYTGYSAGGPRQWGNLRGGSLLDRPVGSRAQVIDGTRPAPPAAPYAARPGGGEAPRSAGPAPRTAAGETGAGGIGNHQGGALGRPDGALSSRGSSRAPSSRSSFTGNSLNQRVVSEHHVCVTCCKCDLLMRYWNGMNCLKSCKTVATWLARKHLCSLLQLSLTAQTCPSVTDPVIC
jgi:hypothetical protein